MKKDEFIASLHQLKDELKQLEKTIMRYSGPQIKQQSTKDAAQLVARKWFERIEKLLGFYDVPTEIIAKYIRLFDDLLHMGARDT